jgi:predicted class III extradiol MEMO1 family dioxygenase/AMMECR1 domain-containing protein
MDTVKKYIDIASRHFTFSRGVPAPKAIFVPHAGFSYSGLCAATAYSQLLPYSLAITKVIILCTHHFGNIDDAVITDKKVAGMPTWISSDERGYLENEHSYTNNLEFIRYVLPKADVLPLLLGNRTPIGELVKYVIGLMNRGYFLVCTSDLTHYGSSYNNVKSDLTEPIQSYVNEYEGKLLNAMITGDTEGCYSIFREYRELTACGEIGIKVLTEIANNLKLNGKVTCHYDSHSISKGSLGDLPSLFTISPELISEFVRYAAIIYSGDDLSFRSKFDDMYLLSIPKSVVDNNLVNGATNLSFCTYCYWSKQGNGAFVTVKSKNRDKNGDKNRDKNGDRSDKNKNDKVRACIGRYEVEGKSTMWNCITSSFGCISDASERWGDPLKDSELDNLSYWITILERRQTWNRYPAMEVASHYKLGDKTGIVLYIPTNAVATFLPSVWEEHPEWSIEKLMGELSYKATGLTNQWKEDPHAYVEIYHTEEIDSITINK